MFKRYKIGKKFGPFRDGPGLESHPMGKALGRGELYYALGAPP